MKDKIINWKGQRWTKRKKRGTEQLSNRISIDWTRERRNGAMKCIINRLTKQENDWMGERIMDEQRNAEWHDGLNEKLIEQEDGGTNRRFKGEQWPNSCIKCENRRLNGRTRDGTLYWTLKWLTENESENWTAKWLNSNRYEYVLMD